MELLAGLSTGLSDGKGATGPVKSVRDEVWVGIDVGKAPYHACSVDATGKVVFTKRVPSSQAEIEALIARAGKAAARVHGRWTRPPALPDC